MKEVFALMAVLLLLFGSIGQAPAGSPQNQRAVKVIYDVASNAAGTQTSIKMAQYLNGSKRMRIDASAGGIEARSYLLDDLFYSCNNQGAWACTKIAISKDNYGNAADNGQDYALVEDGTMSIGGVVVKCFQVTGRNIQYYRSCNLPEGAPLYVRMKSTTEGKTVTTEMKATSYSTSVQDSDFVLPAAPTEFPSFKVV